MAAVNIDDYMVANSLTFPAAFQAIVDQRKAVFIPALATRRPPLTAPIRFKEMLHVIGEESILLSYNPGGGAVYRPWSNVNDLGSNLNGRPMFCDKDYYLDCDNVYRATPSTFSNPYTSDTPLDADQIISFVGNQHIVFDNVYFESFDPLGTILQASAPHPWTVKRCTFAAANRGLSLSGSFLGHMEQCDFTGIPTSATWFNLAGAVVDRYLAGTATAPELAAIAVVEDRMRKAYLLHIAGNATVIGCRINSGFTGMVLNGNNTAVLNLAIERCMSGLVIGGYPVLDVDTLRNSPATNPALAPKPLSGASGCLFQSLGFESNYGGIEVNSGASNRFQDWVVIGHNCRDLAGRDLSNGGTGDARWGINNVSDSNSEYSGLSSTVNDTKPALFHLRSIAGSGYTPFVINETETARDKLATHDTELAALDSGKATVESVQAVDQRVAALDAASVSDTELDALAKIVSDNYLPPNQTS